MATGAALRNPARVALAVGFFKPPAGYSRDGQYKHHEAKVLHPARGRRVGHEQKFRRYCHGRTNQSGKSEDYPVVLYAVRLIALPTCVLAPGGLEENHPAKRLLTMRAFHFTRSMTKQVFNKRQPPAPGFWRFCAVPQAIAAWPGRESMWQEACRQ